MAQTTKTTGKSTGRKSPASKGSAAKRAGSNGTKAKSSGTSRATSNGSSRAKSGGTTRAKTGGSTRAKSSGSTRAKSPNAGRKQSTPQASKGRSGGDSLKDTAVGGAKTAGNTIATVASKAKTPLIAGGTALVGVAAGAAIKGRTAAKRSKNPLKRLGGVSIPKPSKVDLDTVKSAAERVSSYGQQASDIAAAVEKTRKKNK